MIKITNADKSLALGVNLQGGSISYFKIKNKFNKKKFNLLRPEKKIKGKFNIIKTAGFPLTPFCNRIDRNSFVYKGKKYFLKNNTDLGKYYLHGDGWLNKWKVKKFTKSSIQLFYKKNLSYDSPYSYLSNLQFILNQNSLKINLSVKNLNKVSLPFGLGFHPYFPKNEFTLLKAKSDTHWIENKDYIPKKIIKNIKKMNFNIANTLPNFWTNNCFNNWSSSAKIIWPDQKLMLNINSSKNCKFFFLHVSSKKFEKNFKNDYFCFEPMTHAVNAHNMKTKRGLINLDKNQLLEISINFKISQLS
tara:strand:+ start:971 stop:1879 length:909 start_codon:yes stop_codon:yes gene_type:complete